MSGSALKNFNNQLMLSNQDKPIEVVDIKKKLMSKGSSLDAYYDGRDVVSGVS